MKTGATGRREKVLTEQKALRQEDKKFYQKQTTKRAEQYKEKLNRQDMLYMRYDPKTKQLHSYKSPINQIDVPSYQYMTYKSPISGRDYKYSLPLGSQWLPKTYSLDKAKVEEGVNYFHQLSDRS